MEVIEDRMAADDGEGFPDTRDQYDMATVIRNAVFEYIEVCVTTLLIISSLIRIRVFFDKPWHWVLALIVVNVVDLYFVLYDYGINMLCQ